MRFFVGSDFEDSLRKTAFFILQIPLDENTRRKNLEKILVTSALTYANGPLHIGHVAGSYLNADIFVRYNKLLGNDIIYIGGTDDYGTPISIKAEEEGVKPRVIAERYNKRMKKDLDGLNIQLDNFSGTSRPRHIKVSQDFFTNLLEAGYVNKKTLNQFYDEKHKRFLADRYIEGICPHCKSEGARGDQCDKCGKLIDAMSLIEPRSKISGEKPIIKETTHWYINLPKFEKQLREWLATKKYWKDNVLNFIMSWLNEGLIERAITRDLNWGIPIPLENTKGKVLYVWFDAPIGYISSTMEWAEKKGQPDLWKKYWLDPETKLIHFLGKDNIPFHTIIWPAVLSKQKEPFILPYDVPANEFLNLEGQKMSTSRNWTVWVEDYLKYFDGELLRYVLAANAPETKDSDFTWKDFQNKINNDLNNVLGNLANRTFIFIKKYLNGKVNKTENIDKLFAENLFSSGLNNNTPFYFDNLEDISDIINGIDESYKKYKVRRAVQLILLLTRIGNRYFDIEKPWVTIKKNRSEANETLFFCSELLRRISILFTPIMPEAMKKLRKMMNLADDFEWDDIKKVPESFKIGEVSPLFKKIEDAEIEKQLELLKEGSEIL